MIASFSSARANGAGAKVANEISSSPPPSVGLEEPKTSPWVDDKRASGEKFAATAAYGLDGAKELASAELRIGTYKMRPLSSCFTSTNSSLALRALVIDVSVSRSR